MNSWRLNLLANFVEGLEPGEGPGQFIMLPDYDMHGSGHPLSLASWACWLFGALPFPPPRQHDHVVNLASDVIETPRDGWPGFHLLTPGSPDARLWAERGDPAYIGPKRAAQACRNGAANGVADWAGIPPEPIFVPRDGVPAERAAQGIADQHDSMGAALRAIVQWSVDDTGKWGSLELRDVQPTGIRVGVKGMGMETTVYTVMAGQVPEPSPETECDGIALITPDGRITCRLITDMPLQA